MPWLHLAVHQKVHMTHMILAFSKYVSVVREQRNLSQADLSRLIGKSPSYISQLERGKIEQLGLDTFCDIMVQLEVHPGDWLHAYYSMDSEAPGGVQ